MPSGKKKEKKKKPVTVDLMSFLADGGGTPTVPVKVHHSWADEREDDFDGYSSRSNKEPIVLPTAPKAARDPGVDEENIPTNPPYVAYISNLPYDVDDEDLVEFFADMKVSSMRLPKDSNKLRGYGYVEFQDRQSLIDALSMTNTTIKARRVRIEVSNSSNDDRRGGRMGRDNRRDMYDDPERTSGDWRSGPRDEALPSDDSYRNRYDARDRRGGDREGPEIDNKPGAWRDRDASDRGRSTFRDRDRGGGFRDDDRGRDRDREWSRYDRGSGDRDGDRNRGSSFGPRRNFDDWDRDRDRDGMSRRPGRSTIDDAKAPGEPRTRQKLQLQPRTKPIEPIVVKENEADAPQEEAESKSSTESQDTTPAPASAPVPAANIFGAAKPVDTTAREREIEERLAKSYADLISKEDGESDRRGGKEGVWGRRNGEGREDREKDKERPTWRSERRETDDDKSRRIEKPAAPRSTSAIPPRSSSTRSDSDSRGSAPSRAGPPPPKGPQKPNDTRPPPPPERERKDKEKDKDDVNRMPKARDEQAPNFVASNKYSMLPDDVDSDSIDD